MYVKAINTLFDQTRNAQLVLMRPTTQAQVEKNCL